MAQSLESLVVDLRARTKNLERDLDKANRKIATKMKRQGQTMARDLSAGFTKAFGQLAAITGVAVSFGALQNAIRTTVQESSQLDITATKLGYTTDALQALRFAGERYNVSLQTTDMALQRFGRRLGEADAGTGELKATLDRLGISTRDADGNLRSNMDVLAEYAEHIKNASDENEEMMLSMKAFDSEGVAFGQVLKNGAAGLAQLTIEARVFNAVIGQETIKRLAEVDARFTEFKAGMRTTFAEVVAKGFDLSDALGLTGAEAELKSITTQIEQLQHQMERAANARNKGPGSIYAEWQEELDELLLKQDVLLQRLVKGNVDEAEQLARLLNEQVNLKDLIPEDKEPAIRTTERAIARLNERLMELGQTQTELVEKYPQAAAYIMEIAAAEGVRANTIKLTVDEMAKLNQILASTVTPAEKLADQLKLLELAIKAMPERAEEFEEAMKRLQEAYNESLQPDKMDRLLDAWEDMADGMRTSLSEALVEGSASLDRFLERTKQKLAAAALEQAIINPLFGALGFGVGGGGNSPFIFGFAKGGRPEPGMAHIVGEHGPELRIEDGPGTILPNSVLRGLSGTSTGNAPGNVTVHQTINFNSDLATVRNQITSAVPMITQATKAAIHDERRRRPF